MKAVLAALLLAPVAAHALARVEGTDGWVEVKGSLRTFGFVGRGSGLSLTRLRLETTGQAGEHVTGELAVDGLGIWGTGLSGSSSELVPGAVPLRLTDTGPGATVQSGDAQALPQVDRLDLAWESDSGALRVGRQAIGAGSARMFPVIDLWAPFAGFAIDTEYKRGVDAARLTVPLSATAEVEAIAAGAPDLADGAYLGRAHLLLLSTDVTLLAGDSLRQATFGLGLQRNLGGAGLYLETLVRPGLGPPRRDVRVTVGGVYRFSFGLTATVEAHYDGAGAPGEETYARTATRPEFLAGEAFLVARGYVGLGLEQELGALLRAQLTCLENVVDGSVLFSPVVRWDVLENAAIDGGALVGLGSTRTEFGTFPDVLFADVRFYF